MKALIPSLLLLAPIGAFAADEAALGLGLGFEVGTSYYIPAQKPANKGMGNFFAVNLNLGSATVGYYFESLNLKLKNNDNTAPAVAAGAGGAPPATPDYISATDIDVAININEIRMIKPIVPMVAIGLGVGTADIRGTSTNTLAGGAGLNGTQFDTLAPVADIFAIVTPLIGGDKVKATVNVLVGYRYIMIDNLDPDRAGTDYTDTVDNFNGFRVGVSVGIAF